MVTDSSQLATVSSGLATSESPIYHFEEPEALAERFKEELREKPRDLLQLEKTLIDLTKSFQERQRNYGTLRISERWLSAEGEAIAPQADLLGFLFAIENPPLKEAELSHFLDVLFEHGIHATYSPEPPECPVNSMHSSYYARGLSYLEHSFFFALTVCEHKKDLIPCLSGFIKHGASLHPDADYPPLFSAADKLNQRLFEFLVSQGASVHQPNPSGQSLLFSVLRPSGLLIRYASDAYLQKLSSILHLMISEGVDPLQLHAETRSTALHFCSKMNGTHQTTYQIIDFFTSHGVDLTAKNANGETASEMAIKHDNPEVHQYFEKLLRVQNERQILEAEISLLKPSTEPAADSPSPPRSSSSHRL